MNGFTPELPSNNKAVRASISFVPSSSSSSTSTSTTTATTASSSSATTTIESKDSLNEDTIKPRSNSLTSNNSDTEFTKSTHLKWVEAFLLIRKLDPESPPVLDSFSPEKVT